MRKKAFEIFKICELEHKLASVYEFYLLRDSWAFQEYFAPQGASLLVGKPQKPVIAPPEHVPKRSVHTNEGLGAMLHAICHIEFNAINLALDAVWRFNDMPLSFYKDWAQVACEEAQHFVLLRQLLNQLGYDYGDFPAHSGLWDMCEKTQHDIIARMALVPRTLEARGLDATPTIQAKLRQSSHGLAAQIVAALDIILRDEIGHVAIGNHWFGWLCAKNHLDPKAYFKILYRQYKAPQLQPPINTQARLQAGFDAHELEWLLQKI